MLLVVEEREAGLSLEHLLPASCVGQLDSQLLYEHLLQGAPGGEIRWERNGRLQVLFTVRGHTLWLPFRAPRQQTVDRLLQHRQRWQNPWVRFSGILTKIKREGGNPRWYPYEHTQAAFLKGQELYLYRNKVVTQVQVQSCLSPEHSSYEQPMYFVRPVGEQANSTLFVFEHELDFHPDHLSPAV